MAAPTRAEALLERFGSMVGLADVTPITQAAGGALPLGWPEVDELLPEHGLPRAVIEVRASRALGGGTSLALAAIRAAHARDGRAWCGWLDPDATLYSPGVAMAGVDLNRLALVYPPREDLLRIGIKLARSQAFEVIVIDVDPSLGALTTHAAPSATERRARKCVPLDVFVRKLALLAAEGGTTVILLTDAAVVRSAPLPVALRLELARTENTIDVRIGKERHGRVGRAKSLSWGARPRLELAV